MKPFPGGQRKEMAPMPEIKVKELTLNLKAADRYLARGDFRRAGFVLRDVIATLQSIKEKLERACLYSRN